MLVLRAGMPQAVIAEIGAAGGIVRLEARGAGCVIIASWSHIDWGRRYGIAGSIVVFVGVVVWRGTGNDGAADEGAGR
jgi:hypothetical protein